MQRVHHLWLLVMTASSVAACSGEAGPARWLDEPLAELPASLGELGLFTALPDLSALDEAAVAYRPQYELWSNGSHKERQVVLPPGARVDTREREAWRFPAGTLFFKTFLYPDPDETGRLAPVETRVLRRLDDGWEYAAYLWNDGATDATRLDLRTSTEVEVAIDGERFAHEVPAKLDCRKCHESQTSAVIGFDELRLASPLEAAGPSQLEALFARGVLSEPAPAEPASIAEADPQTASVLGYLQGNCAHCHNGGQGPSAAFDLRHPVALQNLIGRESEAKASTGIRVVPGDPDASLVVRAMERREREQAMPPAGVQRIDRAAVAQIRAWIAALGGDAEGPP